MDNEKIHRFFDHPVVFNGMACLIVASLLLELSAIKGVYPLVWQTLQSDAPLWYVLVGCVVAFCGGCLFVGQDDTSKRRPQK